MTTSVHPHKKMENQENADASKPKKKLGRPFGTINTPSEAPKAALDHKQQIDINRRFFQALDLLVEQGKMTRYSFAKNNNIDRPTLYAIKRNVDRRMVPPVFIAYLVKQGRVSAHWILTGEGEMFWA